MAISFDQKCSWFLSQKFNCTQIAINETNKTDISKNVVSRYSQIDI